MHVGVSVPAVVLSARESVWLWSLVGRRKEKGDSGRGPRSRSCVGRAEVPCSSPEQPRSAASVAAAPSSRASVLKSQKDTSKEN